MSSQGSQGSTANAPGNEGGGHGASGGDPAERQARMMERFKAMSPDEQKQFIARMKERGIDTSAFEKAAPEKAGAKPSEAAKSKPGTAQPVQTIDALFAPLPPVESRGRAWLFVDHQLKSVSLRLGITDGTNTELLTSDLAQNTEVVTGITGVGSTRTSTSGTGTGNPLMPGGGRGPGGFGGGQGGRGGR